MLHYTDKKRKETKLVNIFWTEHDQIRIQVLGKEKLPPLNEVISLIKGEESCQNLMLGLHNVEDLVLTAWNNKKSGFNNNIDKGISPGQENLPTMIFGTLYGVHVVENWDTLLINATNYMRDYNIKRKTKRVVIKLMSSLHNKETKIHQTLGNLLRRKCTSIRTTSLTFTYMFKFWTFIGLCLKR